MENAATPPLPEGTSKWGTDLEKLEQKKQQAAAASNRTPGVVLEALEPGTADEKAGRGLHAFTLQTYLNLARLKSPFVEKPEGQEIGVEDIVRALWVMSEPDDKVRYAIRTGGDFLDEKIGAFASSIPMSDLGAVATAIGEHIARSFEPAANLQPPSTEGGGAPLEAVSSATAPAGY
jgi:hypothetical protein